MLIARLPEITDLWGRTDMPELVRLRNSRGIEWRLVARASDLAYFYGIRHGDRTRATMLVVFDGRQIIDGLREGRLAYAWHDEEWASDTRNPRWRNP